MMDNWNIHLMEWHFEDTIQWRRYLHMNPELSYQEKETSAFIAQKLLEFGIDVKTGIGGYGVVGTIYNGEGPIVALRADMDALPIQDEKACEYRSTVMDVMHACGHDGHVASLLSAARLLNQHRDKWKGELRFIFQPAEEVSPGGAQAMIKEGVLKGVDAIYGVHLWAPLKLGQIATREGAMMAAVDDFNLTIYGRGGHGGIPNACIDTVVIGAAIVQQLQSIVSRNVSPLEPAVITVGSIQAGSTQNVIADRAVLKGTIRSFNPEVRELLRARLETMVEHMCAMYGATFQLDYKVGYPAVVNPAAEADRVERVVRETFGEEYVAATEMMMPAEDFSYYLNEIPGCFVFVGAGNDEGAKYPHHHPRFDIEEQAMLHASKLLVALALDVLSSGNIATTK
ncbi:M20 metallopeptidase family protein [Paenibacillus aquistagni]|uniref:M20 metallopeptidase family protein n=1 Tax=Paenibacillus aquistagni TaxID=1852522 RepID=UPI002166650F|nr:amidohydrolase [Paenibacillus aquistagni]